MTTTNIFKNISEEEKRKIFLRLFEQIYYKEGDAYEKTDSNLLSSKRRQKGQH